MKGSGDVQPQRGEICKITYTGRLENGTLVEEATDKLVQIGDVEVNIITLFEFCFINKNGYILNLFEM